jgi:hypothetical protein
VSFLWEALGIKNLMEEPTLDCCGKDILFNRPPYFSTKKALFTWTGTAQAVKSKAAALPYEVVLEIPAKLDGVTIVAPGFTEFHFNTPRPRLTIKYDGTPQFVNDIACTNSSLGFATVKRVGMPGADIPELNLLFVPKP